MLICSSSGNVIVAIKLIVYVAPDAANMFMMSVGNQDLTAKVPVSFNEHGPLDSGLVGLGAGPG